MSTLAMPRTISVVLSLATPLFIQVARHDCAVPITPARYCPRTVFRIASAPVYRPQSAQHLELLVTHCIGGEAAAGGSIAIRHSSCSMWFCTMSRSAPASS